MLSYSVYYADFRILRIDSFCNKESMFVIGLRPEITATFSHAFNHFVNGNNFLQTTRCLFYRQKLPTNFFSSSGVSFSNFLFD